MVDNKRIASNTVLLYFRMLLSMGIGFYSSRVVLNALGVSDFGIYNVVGGITAFFSFFNSSLSSATKRFLNFALGEKEPNQLRKIFNTSFAIHCLVAILTVVLLETAGLCFLNFKLNIPADKLSAANWVLQLSILTLCIQIVLVPFNSLILANEDMSFYAYVTIADSVIRLGLVLSLQFLAGEKLIWYSAFILLAAIISSTAYIAFSFWRYSYCRLSFSIEKKLFHQLVIFSGWSSLGSAANISVIQGITFLVNIFFGVTVNAALAVSRQISAAIYGFTANFQVAFMPQLIQTYAAKQYNEHYTLLMQTSRASFFLLFFIAFPAWLSLDFLLKLWLINPPEFSSILCRLELIGLLLEALSGPIWMSVQATGKIKLYQFLVSMLLFLSLPVLYVALKLGCSIYLFITIRLLLQVGYYVCRVLYLHYCSSLKISTYIKLVMLPIIKVVLLSLPLPLLTLYYMAHRIGGMFLVIVVSASCCGVCIYFFGLHTAERRLLNEFIMRKLKITKGSGMC